MSNIFIDDKTLEQIRGGIIERIRGAKDFDELRAILKNENIRLSQDILDDLASTDNDYAPGGKNCSNTLAVFRTQ